ncbi:exocyst complex component EXO70B1-like [Nymphaea colorata]|uniref:Exocyst subunit Exo70 family protein n=1 Tax=Nymphaea colorata TaxID=210225 RepID=A0A5K1DGA9_9MAGN|nr:exocyst complex component EXO70B1-like [Nymphaea colorata]
MDASEKSHLMAPGDEHDHHDDKTQSPSTPSSRIRSLSLKGDAVEPQVDNSHDHNDEEPAGGDGETDGDGNDHSNEDEPLELTSEKLDAFLSGLPSAENPEIPPCVERFLDGLAEKIRRHESGAEKVDWRHDPGHFPAFIARLNRLVQALSSLEESPPPIANKAGVLLHQAMSCLEDEFRLFLEEPLRSGHGEHESAALGRTKSLAATPDDRCSIAGPPQSPNAPDSAPAEPYTPEKVAILAEISKVMIVSGYDTECCLAYSTARKTSLDASFSELLGSERLTIEDVHKMHWDALESEIAKWMKGFRHCLSFHLAGERRLCCSIFLESSQLSGPVFADLARGPVIRLLNFAEAVAMTRRSTERLFKFLDMYEAFRDSRQLTDELFAGEACAEIRFEIDSARTQLGEAAIGAFSDLENSIKGDSAKTPVPGGAVHPLTRYVMNYLKLACEYKETLRQVFETYRPKRDGGAGGDDSRSSLSVQVVGIMDLLDHNLETKSKLYKDPSLSYIFLMNNGRYIVQKVKGSEIYSLLGDDWYRKRSSDLRQYHKNYQRETWGKVLACFRDEGLHSGGGGRSGGGSVSKPVLKERFKMFNAMFEEIHKNQSSWIVSDEQLQSELRVSISAVIIPAYRSFLGRFSQYFDPGRQTDKYIKYGPEDMETFIDELFEGTPASMIKRKA